MPNVIEPSAHRRGAVTCIRKGQKIGLQQPHQVGRRDDECDHEREPRAGRRKSTPRFRVEQHEQRIGRRQHDDEILCPQRAAEGDAEQQPIADAAALERGMKGVAGQRPKRQLNDVVIEFDCGVLEIMQAIDDQHGNKGAGRADNGACGDEHQGKGDDHRSLRQRVVGGVRADRAMRDLNEPPR